MVPSQTHTRTSRFHRANGDVMGRGSTVKEALCPLATATRSRSRPRAGEQLRDHVLTVERPRHLEAETETLCHRTVPSSVNVLT